MATDKQKKKKRFNARFVRYLDLTTLRIIKIKTRIKKRKKKSMEVTLAIGFVRVAGKLLWNLFSKY